MENDYENLEIFGKYYFVRKLIKFYSRFKESNEYMIRELNLDKIKDTLKRVMIKKGKSYDEDIKILGCLINELKLFKNGGNQVDICMIDNFLEDLSNIPSFKNICKQLYFVYNLTSEESIN